MNTGVKLNSRGFVTIPVLIFVFALTVLGSAFLSTLHISLDQRQRDIHEVKTYTLAESGFQYATIDLNKTPDFLGLKHITTDTGQLDIEIQKSPKASTWLIRSIGKIGDVRAPLYTVVLESTLHKTSSGWTLSPPKRLRRYQWEQEMGT